jgi:hypothetical protein
MSKLSYSVQKRNNVQRIQQQSVTNELVKILENNPKVKDLLVKSIESAKKINPDIKSNPVQTLEYWYTYIDWSLKSNDKI